MKMTLSHRYLCAKLKMLDSLGLQKAESLACLDLSENELSNLDARLDVDKFLDLLNLAEERLGDPDIGLHLGHKFRISTFAQTGSIYGHCETLEQVIALNGRYQKLAIDAGKIFYHQHNAKHYMQFQPYFSDMTKYRHITDVIMGAYSTAYRWLSWSSGEDLLAVHLPYEEPDHEHSYARVFRVPVSFASDLAGVELSTEAMAQKLTTYDPERLTRARAKLDELLGTRDAVQSLDAAVEAAIRGAISNGRVTSQVVADRMGQSWASLRTALKDTDRGFRSRVDDVRKTLFLELYRDGQSFSQIAQALAYNDQPALNRAFHRWYGISPTQWEAEQKLNPAG